jgi:hypothetical protein
MGVRIPVVSVSNLKIYMFFGASRSKSSPGRKCEKGAGKRKRKLETRSEAEDGEMLFPIV